MKITLAHSTIYRYESPVYLQPHLFRLQPRTSTSQRLLSFGLQISPKPAGTSECLDQAGNLAWNAWFDAPTNELSVQSQCAAETLRANPFDYVLPNGSVQLPLRYSEPLSTALTSYRIEIEIDESVRRYARAVAARAQNNTISFLMALTLQIHHDHRQVIRSEGAPWPSHLTLSRREGSCRDLAVLFCDVCRVVGIAARFVSGYECVPASGKEADMHAWSEVYLPGIGWRGYDPSRGLAVADRHVAVAAGSHPDLASPVTGWYGGGSPSYMETDLRVQVYDGV